MTLPVGPQRDACHVLEICFDPTSPMHSSCERHNCYGALLQSLTSFEAKQEIRCRGCSYNTQESQKHCVLHVEPNGDAENSIRTSFKPSYVDFICEACCTKQGTHHTRIAAVPEFLIVHINKYADGLGLTTPQYVRVADTSMERVTVMHHDGHTPESGHYTATIAAKEDLSYFCNDEKVAPWRDLSWPNSYLIFLRKTSKSDTHPLATKPNIEEHCSSDAPPEPCNDNSTSHIEDIDTSEAETGSNDSEGNDDGMDDPDADAEECEVQATECRTTSSRHDDWLHRGPFLADLPWHAYMMRVRRTRKPSEPGAEYSEYLFFDRHYILSVLYCQQIRYSTTAAIPRLVVSACPP